MEKKNLNRIPDRISRIEKILSGKHIESIIDFNNYTDTIDNKSENLDIRDLLPKKYIDFGKAIEDLGGKLLYIKSGSTGHTFKGVHLPPNNNLQSYAVKVVAYPKKENYGDMYNIKRPENVELLMIRLLSQFVIEKATPHIVLPITTFNTSIKPFLKLTEDKIVESKKFDMFIDKYKKGEYYNNVSVLISEWANAGDLLDYIRKNYKTFKVKEWRTIFFQFLSVLAVIQTKYPGFRHNDLKANNLLVHLIETSEGKKHLYEINDQSYILPSMGFHLKLWDFDFASIHNVIDNAKVDAEWTNKINISSEQNRYYDVHYFFNTLHKKGFFPEFFVDDRIPTCVKEFVNRIIPDEYKSGPKVSERGRILVNDEYCIPDTILKTDIFFKPLRR
jgi:hypothetical protein